MEGQGDMARLESGHIPGEDAVHQVSTESRSCKVEERLLTDHKQVFSYYERELRSLRAERTEVTESATKWVRDWTSETSTPQTPAAVCQPLQNWRAPEANMYTDKKT
jgi:hypothetical protein